MENQGSRNNGIKARFGRHIVYASDYICLDSDVYTGGGTDSTNTLQSILDKAPEWKGLHLIMDGAALVSGLNVHSNTTIECENDLCGFYLADNANRSIIRNFHGDFKVRQDKNIMLIGGTYNHNCNNQEHHLKIELDEDNVHDEEKWVIALEFYGVENLVIRDVTIRNQRTFAILVANWYRVNMENITIDLPDIKYGQNQDGIHFWGPGQFLTMRNISGCSGDDFIALAPDENDLVSSISDVLIDGVFLDNADQGIRLLSRAKGRLDRIMIRNITGTYKSFGFYINPWFPGSGGNFGNIVIENVDLRQTYHKYEYTNPFLFRVGGNIDNLTLRNIYNVKPVDCRILFDIGTAFYESLVDETCVYKSNIKSLLIDGLYVLENEGEQSSGKYLTINCIVKNLFVQNVHIINSNSAVPDSCFAEIQETAEIDSFFIRDVIIEKIDKLVINSGNVELLKLDNIYTGQMDNPLIDNMIGKIGKMLIQ